MIKAERISININMKHRKAASIRIIGSELIIAEPWLSFGHKHFIDREGATRVWSYVERSQGQQAVVVIARTRETKRLVLIRQFRIPLEAWVYEFPAGLVDPGETIESTAHRELAEETGYSGEISLVGPAVPSSPGMSSETMHLVTMVAEEQAGEPEHESAEDIEVLTLELTREAVGVFVAQAEQDGSHVDAKLYAFLLAYL